MVDGYGAAVERLEAIEQHLEIVYAGVVVSAAALLHQGAEQDEEIAQVLRHCVGPRLFEQIERLGELVAALKAPPGEAGRRPGGGA